MKYLKWIVCSILLGLIIGIYYINKTPSYDLELNVSEKSLPQTYNPQLATDMVSKNVALNTLATLKVKTYDQELKNYGAKIIKYNRKSHKFSIKIRDDLKYENGTKIKIDDYIYALKYALNPHNKVPDAGILTNNIIGANDVYQEKQANLKGIKKVNNQTMEIYLNKDFSDFENYFSNFIFSPLSEQYFKNQGKLYGTSPNHILSSGPYKFSKKTANKIVYIKNNEFTINNVKTKYLIFNIIAQENINAKLFNEYKLNDLEQTNVSNKLVKNDNLILKSDKTASSYYLIANAQTTNNQENELIFQNINKKMVNKNYFANKNEVINALVPKRDVFKNFIIKKQKWNDNKKVSMKGKKIKLLVANEFLLATNFNAFVKYLVHQMENSGFDVELITQPFNVVLTSINQSSINSIRNYDYVLSGWSPQTQQTNEFFEMFRTTSTQNVMNLNDVKYDQILDDFNQNKQKSINKLIDILNHKMLNLWVNKSNTYYHKNSQQIKYNGYLLIQSEFKNVSN